MNIFKSLHKIQFSNTQNIALITFFSSLYLYGHVGTLYLQARGLNLFQASSIWTIIIGTIFLAEVPTGILADKIGRKKSVIIALLLQFLGEVLYIFASTYIVFVLIAILAGVGFAFASGCIEALIYDTLVNVDKETAMKKAMGLKGSAYYLAFFFAPLLGSFLIPVFTIPRFVLTVFLTACSVFIAFILALTLKDSPNKYQHQEESSLSILKNGINCIRGNKFLLWLVGISVFSAGFAGALGTLFQPYFSFFEMNAQKMGIASAIGALLAIILQKKIVSIEQLLGKQIAFTLSIVLPGLGYILLATAPSPSIAFLAFLFTYGVMDLKNPLVSSYQNGVIPEKIRATVLSLINLLVSLYAAGVGLTMGWLADINVHYPFALAGVLILFFAIIMRTDKISEKLNLEGCAASQRPPVPEN